MTEAAERLAIRDLVENWVLWRDAGDWDRFRTVWHDDGRMMATWRQGTAAEFIQASREGWDRGVRILHFLGGTSIDLAMDLSAPRAIAQTKMTISQRAKVHDVLCDVVCTGRFYDFFEKRNGGWGLVLRQPIYEKDRMDPVDPAATIRLELEPTDFGVCSGWVAVDDGAPVVLTHFVFPYGRTNGIRIACRGDVRWTADHHAHCGQALAGTDHNFRLRFAFDHQ